jgi:hypothetical protein
MHAPPVTGPQGTTTRSPENNPWLDHLGRGMYLRAHISVFAVGCVVLLGIDLLGGSGGIWADTAIGAWGMLLVVHGILMIIARLLQELLADDDEQPIRPASEMQWHAPSTWTLPAWVQQQSSPSNRQTSDAAPAPPQAGTDNSDRVSWQAATDAAWLAPKDTRAAGPADPPQPSGSTLQDVPDNRDDDFVPLKLD